MVATKLRYNFGLLIGNESKLKQITDYIIINFPKKPFKTIL